MDDNPPEWKTELAERWDTHWSAMYQIIGAKPVMVRNLIRTEKEASKVAQAGLDDALSKILDLGLEVEAACWTIKHRTRKQTQMFDPSNVKEYVTADWYGNLTVVLKTIHEARLKSEKTNG